jgi:SPP1 family predicted phage head-tail adaptor
MYSDEIKLIARVENGTNDIGDVQYTETSRTVYVDLLDVGQSEYYQARAQGLKAQHKFEMRLADYNKEERLEFEGTEYDIIRTYRKNKDYLEIIAGGIVNNGAVN